MNTYALDIETITVNADDYINEQYAIEKSKAESKYTTKLEKIAADYKRADTIEKHNKAAENDFATSLSSLRDKIERKLIGSRSFTQVICIGLAYERGGDIAHKSFYGADEKDVIRSFASFVDLQSELRFVTYNGDSFDIPQLIAAFSRHDVRLHSPIRARDFIDLMKYPFERFCGTIKLDELADIYDIKVPGTDYYKVTDFEGVDLDGSYVAEMHKLDKLDSEERVAAYCAQDTFKTLRIYQEVSRMVAV